MSVVVNLTVRSSRFREKRFDVNRNRACRLSK